jgi:hypothetical protein
VTLTPDARRDCPSYLAVRVFVDRYDHIVAVDLVLSEP